MFASDLYIDYAFIMKSMINYFLCLLLYILLFFKCVCFSGLYVFAQVYNQYQMSIKNSEQKTMKCPFDPSHVMPYERFLNHLEKCKFQDKKSYRKCKFNPYHVFHMETISNHQNKCPDRLDYALAQDDWGVQQQPIECSKTVISVSTSYSVQSNNFSDIKTKATPQKSQKNRKNQKQLKQEKSIVEDKKQNSMVSIEDF